VRSPTQTVMFGEINAGAGTPQAILYNQSYQFCFFAWYGAGSAQCIDWLRHGPVSNWAFFDGHGAGMTYDEFWAVGGVTGHGWVE
jgi:prepilin-type processing-associated H-X9-DG protein